MKTFQTTQTKLQYPILHPFPFNPYSLSFSFFVPPLSDIFF